MGLTKLIKSFLSLATLLVILALSVSGCSATEPIIYTHSLIVLDGENIKARYDAEFANTAKERQTGLMHRQVIPPNTGMMFDFGEERIVHMWMRNTPASLDMIFINKNMEIVRIAHDTEPFSETVISSGAKVKYVFEVPAGSSEANEIKIGHTIQFSPLSPSKS